MNQLVGKYVNVVLSVECGRGMDFLRNKVYITANFNGRILESDHIPPEESPPFNTELVWEIEKKELRKIRCGNLPLRVECITVDSQSRKERIGFALLSLRSAQIIPQSMSQEPVTPIWQKLIGCQADKKKSHPELYLSLTLRDHLSNEEINIDCTNGGMPFIVEEDNQLQEESIIIPNECPIKYYENGYIQIGDEQVAKTQFVFNLQVIDVNNLDTLLPEALVFQANTSSYFLTFKMFGIIIKTKPFDNQMYGNLTLNEKIVVNLLSTHEILEDFLKTQTINIIFYYGYDKLGVTKMNFDNVWSRNDEKYYFKLPAPNGTVPFGSTAKSPFITLETWIDNYFEPVEKEVTPIEQTREKPKARSIFSNVSKTSDYNMDARQTLMAEEPTEPPKVELPDKIVAPLSTKSIDTVAISDTLSARSSSVLNSYEKFVIVINLKYLTWITNPPSTKIMFKFLHPKARSCTTIFTELSNEVNQKIPLNNLYVRIAYISTPDRITNLLKYWQPRLVLADENEEYITEKRSINSNCLETKSNDFEVEFRSLKSSVQLAKIGVSVNFNIANSRLEDDYENLFLLPVIVDERMIINEISDMDSWKQEEKMRAQQQLDDLKLCEIQRLEKEYEDKKKELESKTARILEKCERIQEELARKLISMKLDKKFTKKLNNQQNLYEDIFEENWSKYSNENSKELIGLLSEMQKENVILKEICHDQKKELTNINKLTLTKANAAKLLQEVKMLENKFAEVQRAKSYFKERWMESSEEVRHIKTEDFKDIKAKINQNKEKLCALNLESFREFYGDQTVGSELS